MDKGQLLKRRNFLTATAMAAFSTWVFDKNGIAQQVVQTKSSAMAADTIPKPQSPPKPAPLEAGMVIEWVRKAHSDLAYVQTTFEQNPTLLNASWDWGGGDFETALEAAGHVGNKDIANFLLSKGARLNIFCAAMLGKLDIVKPILNTFPDLKNSKGPHGLQLIHHAKKGGTEAESVLEYLISIGAS